MGVIYETLKTLMKININSITHSEVDIFWNLFVEILESQFPGYSKKVITFMVEKIYSRNFFIYWLNHSIKTVFLVYADNKAVGFAVIDEPYGGVSFCRWLGIKKEYQRQGIGTKLIQKWLDLARQSGCHKAEVAAQPTARDFYKKVGLVEEGMRVCSYFGIDQYVFGKVIGKPNDEVMTRQL